MKTLKVILCFFISVSFSCNDLVKKVEDEKEDRISAKWVNNPITAEKGKQTVPLPELSFDKLRHNFGKINQGESVSHQFVFTNTGQAELIIDNAKGSCGCTVPKWPRKPIAPGESEEIKVTFNSAGKSGKQSKTITLVTNAIPNTTVLTISANILTEQTKEKQ
ncbi:MAG: DUF1573 domain-containing protein [Bacteroidota bacterium]|nr:DUF1573 domain-containing protein [Bacteroidota bacterium]